MGKTGRSKLKWFFITFFTTAIPAVIVLFRDRRDALMPKPKTNNGTSSTSIKKTLRQCPHCAQLIDEADEGVCPSCKLTYEQDSIA